MNQALIVVDIQNDFCEGGSLQVDGGAEVAARVSAYLKDNGGSYKTVVATRDWHIDPGGHFADEPDWVDTWPHHCVAGTEGAEFHPALNTKVDFGDRIDTVFSKGQYTAAYSGFEGTDSDGGNLDTHLRSHDIDSIDIVGLTTDHCAAATAGDAIDLGYRVRLLTSMCAGVAPDTTAKALAEMQAAGVEIVDS